MIPALFLILIFLAGVALTQSGGKQGMEFIFSTDFSRLKEYRVWLEALTQSAWSTGAGWGLALTYACYSREHDDPVLTSFTTGLGNNAGEIVAGLAIIPSLFSFFAYTEVMGFMESGNTGLTFIALPGLFQKMPAGHGTAVLFFIALFFAAFASLISMFELGAYFLANFGFGRGQAALFLAACSVVLGAPSALNLSFLDNQDWVWGIGLLLSGFFFSLLMRHLGVERFSRDFVPLHSRFHRFIYQFLVFWMIPVEFLFLVVWWFYQAILWDPTGWWDPFGTLTVGTCLVQWGLLLGLLLLFNRKMSKKMKIAV
jgi:NSS family neurotransmitter:Na+ symporter